MNFNLAKTAAHHRIIVVFKDSATVVSEKKVWGRLANRGFDIKKNRQIL